MEQSDLSTPCEEEFVMIKAHSSSYSQSSRRQMVWVRNVFPDAVNPINSFKDPASSPPERRPSNL